MSKQLTPTMIMAVAALSLAAPLNAQGRSGVTGAELDAAVTARPIGNGDAVRELLMTDQARKVAGRMGISPAELSVRVAALDQATLNRLAEQTGVNDQALAGGSTVVIGTTVLIIALLVLIILLVA